MITFIILLMLHYGKLIWYKDEHGNELTPLLLMIAGVLDILIVSSIANVYW